MRSLLALVIFASAAAHAQSISPAVIEGDLLGYYGGEAASVYIVGSLSIAAIGAGVPMVIANNDVARGMGWPLLILGGLELIGAFIYGFEVAAETDRYRALLHDDPAAFQRVESAHIRGTTESFVC